MKFRVDYRAQFSESDKFRPDGYLDHEVEHDLPDDTESFLKKVAPLGRFRVDMSKTPPELFFENDYD